MAMREQLIIAAMLADRKVYETVERLGGIEDFSPLGLLVTRASGEYYECDPSVGNCSREFIEARLLRDIKNPKHEGPLRDYIQGLPGDASPANIERELAALHKQRIGGKIALAFANDAPEEEKQKLIADYERAGKGSQHSESAKLVDPLDTADMLEEKCNVEFIRLFPKALNDRLDGGALRGHHVLVFARPETGKTLFAINLAVGFLHQKLSVLYGANEEPIADIRDRIRGRLLKVPRSEIRASRDGSLAARLGKGSLGRLRIAGDATAFSSVRQALVAPHDGRFDVVILDQLRNMRVKAESRTNELEAAGIEARAIAKDFNVLVVSITQAGDSASGKAFLEMSDVDGSKTGIPASADLMIGLGADSVMQQSGMLGLSLCKNKLSGLHDKFSCTVNYSTGVIS